MVKEKVEFNLFTFTTLPSIKKYPKSGEILPRNDRGISPGQLTLSSLIEIFTKSVIPKK